MNCFYFSNRKIYSLENKNNVIENTFYIYNAFPNDNDFYIINNSWCNFNSFFLKNKKIIIQNLNIKPDNPEINHLYDLFFFMFLKILKNKNKNVYNKFKINFINNNNLYFSNKIFYCILKSNKISQQKIEYIKNLHTKYNISKIYYYIFGEVFIDTISLFLSLLYSGKVFDDIIKSWKINISYFISIIQNNSNSISNSISNTNNIKIIRSWDNINRISPLQQEITNIQYTI